MPASKMSRKAQDLTGHVYDRLTVLFRGENGIYNRVEWVCECTCGNIATVCTNNLVRGKTRSCGCLYNEKVVKHGMHGTPEYVIWCSIKARCYNTAHPHYLHYGGSGITMCDEWQDDFSAFYRDMGPRPSPEHSIDRRENDKGYDKDNCHWTDDIAQANNRSNNIRYTFDGETKTLAEWCLELNLNYHTVYSRLQQGWDFEKAITKPIRPKRT